LTTSCSASSVSSIGVSRVPAVDLVQVDVVHAQAAQAAVDLFEDRLARQPAHVGPGRMRPKRTLVAITISSRRAKSRSARPTISSLVPSE
jgi:hypothetical protein